MAPGVAWGEDRLVSPGMAAGSGLDNGEVRRAVDRISVLPVTPAVAVSGHLWLKLENLQPTGSFKVRGFLNAVRRLGRADLRAGIVTVSAGNAALAAAYVARMAGIGCTVVMFDSAPAAKRDGVRALGAEVLSWPRPRVLAWMAGRAVEVVGGQSSGYPLWLRTFAEGAPPALVPDTIADGTTAPYELVMHDRLRS